MWQKTTAAKLDSLDGRITWYEGEETARNLNIGGYTDWRLPNQKELHSIVDYEYIPVINPIFHISDPKAWFWSSTPFIDMPGQAIYVAFGPATGKTPAAPEDEYDVHGAGVM